MSDQMQPAQPALPEMPPTPRDFSNPSMSELIPFSSKKINIFKSGILLPAAVTAAVCTLMWSVSNFVMTMNIIGGYLLLVMFYAAYVYSNVKTPIYVYVIPCLLVYAQLETSAFSVYSLVFREILPGGHLAKDSGFIATFINMFFGAGLCEETLKATPALLGLWIGRRTAQGKPLGIPGLSWFKVTSPIEGMMMGLAAGAMFIFLETLFEYVPRTIREVGGVAGVANGFWLLFPRTLQGITGHMGWAAISGYFIGMAARYPRSAWKLILIGLLVPSVLHGFWNSSSAFGAFGRWTSSALSLIFFVGCMLKAKQLEAMNDGRAFVPTQSILAGTPMPSAFPATIPPPVVEQHATSWGGLAHVLSTFIPTSGPIPAVTMPTATVAAPIATVTTPRIISPREPAAAAPTMPAEIPTARAAPATAVPIANNGQAVSTPQSTPRFTLAIGAAKYGIVAGQMIDLSVLFPSAGLPQGSLADVVVNSKDPSMTGLKNKTEFDWTATTAAGTQVTVLKGRNVKLVDGEKIAIGPAEIIVQAI